MQRNDMGIRPHIAQGWQRLRCTRIQRPARIGDTVGKGDEIRQDMQPVSSLTQTTKGWPAPLSGNRAIAKKQPQTPVLGNVTR